MKKIPEAFLMLLIFNDSCLTYEISNSVFKCCGGTFDNGSITRDCDVQRKCF